MSARRTWAVATAGGGGAALLVNLLFLLGPDRSFFGPVTNGHFYEVQARALLEGRWDVPPDSIGVERFRVGGRFFEYFGPFPALLRLPVVAVTDRLDGRLSRLAVLLAVAVLLAGAGFLAWQLRGVHGVRGDVDAAHESVSRRDAVGVAVLVFLCGCATPVLFLASWTAVYHEAIAWGAAWAVVSFALVVAHLRSASSLPLVLAGITAALSLLSRASVGLGPVVALALVAVMRLWAARRSRSGVRLAGIAVACAVVPVALNVYVSWAKFGTFRATPPLDKQDLLLDWPPRIPAMEANGGTLFGLGYAPTIALQYLRPDSFSIDRLFPWFGFSDPPNVVGDAVFEALNPSASITSSSPVFVLLAAAAVVVAVRWRRSDLVPILAGGAAGCAGMFSLAFIDHRYLGDAVPLLVIGGAIAFAGLRQMRRRVTRGAVAIGIAVLGAWSVAANAALAYQHQHGWSMDATTASRAEMVRTQLAVHDVFASSPPSRVLGALPAGASRPHSLAITGACAAIHWSDGREWHPVETTAATGHGILDLSRAAVADGEAVELADATDRTGTSSVWLLTTGRIEYRWLPSGSAVARETIRSARAVEGRSVEVHLDRAGAFSSRVRVSDRRGALIDADAPVAVGRLATALETIVVTSPDTPICDRLRRLGFEGDGE